MSNLPARRSAAVIPFPPSPTIGRLAAAGAVVEGGVLRLQLENTGGSPLQLAVCCHHLAATPVNHDLYPGEQRAADVITVHGTYDVAVHGPNGFVARLAGDAASTLAGLEASLEVTGPAGAQTLRLVLQNADFVTRAFKVSNRLGGSAAYRVPPRSAKQLLFQPLQHDHGWYDLAAAIDGVTSWGRRFAGHLENAERLSAH
jgi:phospholipase C